MNEFICQVPEGYYCEFRRNFLNGPDYAGILIVVSMLLLLAGLVVWMIRND